MGAHSGSFSSSTYAFEAILARPRTDSLSVTSGPGSSSTIHAEASRTTGEPCSRAASSRASIVSGLRSTNRCMLVGCDRTRIFGFDCTTSPSSPSTRTVAFSGTSNLRARLGYLWVPWWKTCLNVCLAISWVSRPRSNVSAYEFVLLRLQRRFDDISVSRRQDGGQDCQNRRVLLSIVIEDGISRAKGERE